MEIKFELVTVHGEDVLMRTAVNYMDDELREEIHAEMAPCTAQAFCDEYARRHMAKYGQEWIIN